MTALSEGWHIELLDDNYYRYVYLGKPKERKGTPYDKDSEDTQEPALCAFMV